MFEWANERVTKTLIVFRCIELIKMQDIRIQSQKYRIQSRQWWSTVFLRLRMKDP